MMKKIYFCLLLVFCYSYSSINVIAQHSFSFLNLNYSARASALGGAFVSVSNDASGILVNPSTAATLNERTVAGTFLKHALDINSGFLVFSDKISNSGYLGANILFSSYGDFDRSNSRGTRNGSFGANDIALGISYANNLDSNLYYGTTVKFIYSNIADVNSTAVAMDLGLLYAIPKSRVNIGMSILNIGTQLSKYVETSESLPVDVRIGINHRLRGLPLLINFSFHHLADNADSFTDRFGNFSIGGEFYFGKSVQARLGYNNLVRKSVITETQRGLSGFSAGVGILLNSITIDYGAASLGTPLMLHRLSVGIKI